MSLINNIIIKIKKENKYNKVIKEIVKNLVKNNLYIKLKKYK